LKIAIFGGSFDPPHTGHEAIVREALKSLDMDRLFIVPTYLNPFKKSFFLDETMRFKLLQKLFKSEKKVEICDYEIVQKRAVYTIETVKFLQQQTQCSTIYLIIGEDNLQKLPAVEFIKLPINIDVSSTDIRENGYLSHIPEKIKCDLKQILEKR
jgi:nicotinate-nucleotide adenylyltransferase